MQHVQRTSNVAHHILHISHRTPHIAHRVSHIVYTHVDVYKHVCMLSWGISIKWSGSVEPERTLPVQWKRYQGKNLKPKQCCILNSHRITWNAHEIRNNVHIIIIHRYSRANKTLIHNALQCDINFFPLPSKCKQLSEQLKCTLQINFCKIHLHPNKMLYYTWKPFWEFIVLHCTNEIYHIASLALCGSEKEIQGMGKNCVKHLKKVARK